MKKAILVDVDDCIINVTRRKSAIFSYLLNKKIKVKDIIGKRTIDVLKEHVSLDKIKEYRKEFWRIALCINEVGKKFIKLDKPEPYSRIILKKLSKKFSIIYITNRIESMREITVEEIKNFKFPNYENIFLADDSTFEESFKDLTAGRKNLMKKIPKNLEYECIIDDLPENFTLYKCLSYKYIIGFMKYIELDERKFYEKGSNFVIRNWKEFPLKLFL